MSRKFSLQPFHPDGGTQNHFTAMFRQIGEKLNLKIRICHRIGIPIGKLRFLLWFPMQIALIFPSTFAIVIRVAVCIAITIAAVTTIVIAITIVAFLLATAAAFIGIGIFIAVMISTISVTVAIAASWAGNREIAAGNMLSASFFRQIQKNRNGDIFINAFRIESLPFRIVGQSKRGIYFFLFQQKINFTITCQIKTFFIATSSPQKMTERDMPDTMSKHADSVVEIQFRIVTCMDKDVCSIHTGRGTTGIPGRNQIETHDERPKKRMQHQQPDPVMFQQLCRFLFGHFFFLIRGAHGYLLRANALPWRLSHS